MILKFSFSSDGEAEAFSEEIMESCVVVLGVYITDNDVLLIIPQKHNLPNAAMIFAKSIKDFSLIKYLVKPSTDDRAIADEYSNIASAHLKFSETIINQKPELN